MIDTEKGNRKIYVKFVQNQGSEDVFREILHCRYYVRQPVDDGHVRWLSATRCDVGYEPDTPLPVGTEICLPLEIYPDAFEVVEPNGGADPVSKRKCSFSYEFLDGMEEWFRADFDTETFEVWKDWLLSAYTSEDSELWRLNNMLGVAQENWLFFDHYTERKTIHTNFKYIGKMYYLEELFCRHKKCSASWSSYQITDENHIAVRNCGYANMSFL